MCISICDILQYIKFFKLCSKKDKDKDIFSQKHAKWSNIINNKDIFVLKLSNVLMNKL